MNLESWPKVKEVFEAALAHPAAERATFLDRACAGDQSLRQEVESLLMSYDEAESFLETPAVQSVARSLAGDQNKLSVGQRISHYEILASIGEGGMGEVYLARDTRLDRKVAIKILPRYVATDSGRLRRLQQEARTASALNHPNVCVIHEIGETEDGQPFISMEYIEGVTLREKIYDERTDLKKLLRYLQHVAEGLAKAHAARIVHRDLKPDNIMITRDGHAKILDFGLAKLTEQTGQKPNREGGRGDSQVSSEIATAILPEHSVAGMILGTVGYMSPEQAQGRVNEIDHRSDIFSFGCILFEAITHQRPFEGKDKLDSLHKLVHSSAPQIKDFDARAPDELQKILRRCLAKDPEERYDSIKDVAIELKELRRALEGAEVTTVPPERLASGAISTRPTTSAKDDTLNTRPASSAEYIVTEIKRNKKTLSVIAGLVFLLLVGITGYFYMRRLPVLTDKDTVLVADFENTTGDPVFDGTLKDALAVQLEQSPFLSIFPEEQIRQTLRFMKRSPNERLTAMVAREICERQGIKAYFTGSVASLGRNYVIKLEAVNARSGDTLAREQIEADGKEQVLKSVGKAVTSLREKLGESLASVQKFDTPIAQATTSSLDALKAFSLGNEERRKNHTLEAIPLYKRAIELDHDFALAYAALAGVLNSNAQRDEAADAATKAFERRERVSEREKYVITLSYYGIATGDVLSEIEAANLWAEAYPREPEPHAILANNYRQVGEFSKAVAEGDQAIRLAPNSTAGHAGKAFGLVSLNRLDQAKEVLNLALAKGLDSRGLRNGLFLIALVQGDDAAMQQQLDWARGRSDEQYVTSLESTRALQRGQLRLARQLMDRAVERAQRSNLKEAPADFASLYVEHDAFIGTCRYVREDVATMLAVSHSARSLLRGATSMALCGELPKAESLAEELLKQHPKDTLSVVIELPATRAAIEIRRGNPEKAIQLLQAASAYANASFYWHPYLLGLAYLKEKKGAEAAGEFQKIIDNPGQSLATSLYPLAYLGLARAELQMGDKVKARKAYDDFFAQWKDADPDIPILIEAKKEYARL
jgi:eukaryotic-like serine/threonine-protein kinase